MDDAVIRCLGSKICSPFLPRNTSRDDAVCYVSAGTSEIYECRASDQHVVVTFTGGEPNGAQVDTQGRIHIADCGHAAVLRVDDSGQPGLLVKAYEDRTFRGPSSVAICENGSIYFTDSGPLGETTLEKPRGSVFCIAASSNGSQLLRPVILDALAHPCGLAASEDGKVMFVAELMQNRVLRIVQRPPNAHHVSVFYQFSGGMGPSCVVVDAHNILYVGHYDFAGSSASTYGKISVISSDGSFLHTLEVPAPEISGLCLSADQTFLYVTEVSTNCIYKVPVR
ncbi:TPA: hypothetical protein N0F65_000981 [Lagenidium giganteum]|uniref:SMP-30/Gluconolactonase/LRE-like region domain-containing protein n=1 Tax=Lagenidium giganteum TaxID=4803 RepID=A0AAV2YVA0_9STRA|nr:TPA: hypothetical protein N0F65_000981 [Lagenidium giganteum]